MDSKKECILVQLLVSMVKKYGIVGILALQKLAIFEQNAPMMIMAILLLKDRGWILNVGIFKDREAFWNIHL